MYAEYKKNKYARLNYLKIHINKHRYFAKRPMKRILGPTLLDKRQNLVNRFSDIFYVRYKNSTQLNTNKFIIV